MDQSVTNKTILIIGINYWPEETGNAPYTAGIAEHLAANGNDVHVVAGMPYYPSWTIREGYEGKLRATERRNGVTIHRFRQYIPSTQSAVKRTGFEASFLLNAMAARNLPKPDFILGFLPSLSDGVLCVIASRRYGVPFGLLIQDLVGQSAAQSGIKGGQRVAGMTRAIEGWVSRQASMIAVVAEGFRPHLLDMGVEPDRIVRVRNWTHVGSATESPESVRTSLGLPTEKTIVLHAGNMGLKQGLENVVDAIRLAESSAPNLFFVMMGGGNQRDMLQDRAKGLTNIRFLPPQPEEVFPDILAAADILLVNQRPSVVDMSLPGKLTSYFSSGRPVVAAVNPTSETRREIEAADAGIVVDGGNPAGLLAAICELAGDPDRTRRLGQNGRRYQQAHLTPQAALSNIDSFIARIQP